MSKRKPLTVALIARRFGVSEAAVYRIIRVARDKQSDHLWPVRVLAERQGFSKALTTNVLMALRRDGDSALRELRRGVSGAARANLCRTILASRDPDVKAALAENRRMLKKIASGV
ncbi:hypothetical protein [Rhodopseudomonas pseudopalustris]|uniref:hypothetical protein n=1 Tax=Rhodopseudomonas pseudopalustris TaxID=1513892 RepID=UPI0011142535|nr:hypothetical protein [Rhodopseudomonas pseudopalustris]